MHKFEQIDPARVVQMKAQGLSTETIALRLGIQRSAVYKLLRRAEAAAVAALTESELSLELEKPAEPETDSPPHPLLHEER